MQRGIFLAYVAMMHWSRVAFVGGVALCVTGWLVGCGGLPVPNASTPPVSQYERVPYPPPPGRVEEVVPPPAEGLVWVDGRWSWQGTRFRWERGAWFEASSGFHYALSDLRLNKDGSFDYAEGGWLNADGTLVEPPPLAYGVASDDEIVDEIGNEVDVGPTTPSP